jgi:hypothetical protein
MPDVEAGADRCRRALFDAKVPDELREPAEDVILQIKAKVTPVPSWR